MKDDRLSFSVPLVGPALTAVGEMLIALAAKYPERRYEVAEFAGGVHTSCKCDTVATYPEKAAAEMAEPAPAPQPAVTECASAGDFQPEQVNAAAMFAGLPGGQVAQPPVVPAPLPVAPGAQAAGGAPTMTAQPPQSATAGAVSPTVELDKNGIPWDSRIHVSTKTKCKTGEWKKLKGLDPNVLAQVEAELKGQAAAPVATPPAAPVPPAAPTAPADPTVPTTLAAFITEITQHMSIAGDLTLNEVNDVCAKHNVPNLSKVGENPELIATLYGELRSIWLTRA